jgi:hypothetical protein
MMEVAVLTKNKLEESSGSFTPNSGIRNPYNPAALKNLFSLIDLPSIERQGKDMTNLDLVSSQAKSYFADARLPAIGHKTAVTFTRSPLENSWARFDTVLAKESL